jgi:hypothetical protein
VSVALLGGVGRMLLVLGGEVYLLTFLLTNLLAGSQN